MSIDSSRCPVFKKVIVWENCTIIWQIYWQKSNLFYDFRIHFISRSKIDEEYFVQHFAFCKEKKQNIKNQKKKKKTQKIKAKTTKNRI